MLLTVCLIFLDCVLRLFINLFSVLFDIQTLIYIILSLKSLGYIIIITHLKGLLELTAAADDKSTSDKKASSEEVDLWEESRLMVSSFNIFALLDNTL